MISQRHITILLAVLIATTAGILIYRSVLAYTGSQLTADEAAFRDGCLDDLSAMAKSTGQEGYYWSRMRQCVELGGLGRTDFDLDRLNR